MIELEAMNHDLKVELQKYYLPRVHFIMQSRAFSMGNDICVQSSEDAIFLRDSVEPYLPLSNFVIDEDFVKLNRE